MQPLTMLTLLVLGASVLSTGDAAKCDHKIIHEIRKVWGEKVPRDLIKTGVEAGKMAMVRATSAIAHDDLKCMLTFYRQPDHKHGAYLYYDNQYEHGFEKGDVYVSEQSGHLENQWPGGPGKAFRYEVYHKGSVWAYYKCEEEGKEGPPQGFVKVQVSTDDKKGVEAAEKVLQELGIHATKKLPAKCEEPKASVKKP